MRVFKRYVSARSVALFASEGALVFGSFVAAAEMHGSLTDVGSTLAKILLVVALCEAALYYNDFYDLTAVQTERDILVRLLQAAGGATIILAILYFIIPSLDLGVGVVFTSMGLLLVAILLSRLLFNHVAGTPRLGERVLIVGSGPASETVAREIASQRDFGYHVVGFVDEEGAAERVPDQAGSVQGTTADLSRIVAELKVDRIIVGMTDRRGTLPTDALLEAKLSGIVVEDAMTAYERITGKILLDHLRPSWLIFSNDFRVSRLALFSKRTFDLVVALIVAAITWPLMLLTSLAIFIETGRPIFYSQERVGKDGQRFTLRKFRSMKADAERGTPVWAQERDDRITRVGRVIRLTRLDELPQLWNVIRGEMSVVGPRPERPFFVEKLQQEIPYYRQRHAVRPGLTGWAQVRYRYGASVEDAAEKLRYDLYYIKHLSVTFDLTILFDTVKVILIGKGAL